MRMTKTLVITGILILGFSSLIEAKCRKSHICDDYGRNCRVQDICDSTLDLPSVGLAPIKSLSMPGLKPLPSIRIPPIGTSKCRQTMVNGNWQNICW